MGKGNNVNNSSEDLQVLKYTKVEMSEKEAY